MSTFKVRRLGALIALSLSALAASAALAADGGYVLTRDGVIVTPAQGPAAQVRLQVMAPRIIHVTALPGADVRPVPSLMVTAHPATGGFTVKVHGDDLALTTPQATAEVSLTTGRVRFRDAAGKVVLSARDAGAFKPVTVLGKPFYAISQDFNPGTDEAFYGLGQHQSGQMNYNGQDVELSQYNRSIAVPFVLSSRNYGVLWDNDSISRFGDPIPYGLASRDLTLYDGSMGEWAKDASLPIETD